MTLFATLFNRRRAPVLLILVLAFAVRVWDIRARALWFDEASEYWVATAPYADLMASARTGSGDPPLYAFVLHTWMKLGSTEVWLRLLSALASTAGVAGVMVLSGVMAGPAAAVCAGLLLAVLPADVRYAQEVGQYGFVPALLAWNLVCLVQLMRHGTWRWVLGWAATALAATYMYYGAVLPLASAFLCVIVESIFRRNMRARRATGTGLILYVIGLVPLLISYFPTQLARVLESSGNAAAGESLSFARILADKWRMTCGLIGFQFTGWPHTNIPPVAVIVPVILFMVLAVRKSWRLVIWLAVAINVYAAVSAAGVFPMGYRWGMILTPLIICATATGIAAGLNSRAKWATIAVSAALVVVCVVSLPNRSLHDRVFPDATGSWPETEDMRVVTQYWKAHRAPDQPTYVYYGAAPAFAYYTRDFAPRPGLPSTWFLSCWHDAESPGYCRENGVYYGHWIRLMDSRVKVSKVFETIGQPNQFWIVFGHLVPGDDRDMVSGIMQYRYRIDAAVEGVNASAYLLVREP